MKLSIALGTTLVDGRVPDRQRRIDYRSITPPIAS